MTRYRGWHDAAAVQRFLQGQPAARGPHKNPAAPRRWTTPRQIPHGWCLVYEGKLPRMNVECPDWRKRWQLKQACLRQFGILPMPATQFAQVTITRVLGPRERVMDTANLIYALKGLEDSLVNRRLKPHGLGYRGGGNYIVDDDPHHVAFLYRQDATRRGEGPRIELEVRYQP